MKSIGRLAVISAGLAFTLAATAGADVVQVAHTPLHMKNVNISAPSLFGGAPFTIVPTATFGWTRTDTPSAGSEVPLAFGGFCLQVNEPVDAGATHSYEVLTLEEAGYAAPVAGALGRLWTRYRDQATTIDTSAAFQLAVWEIVHDEGGDLLSGGFSVNSIGDARTTAQVWLHDVETGEMPDVMPEFRVLRSGSVQDQLMVVPAPSAAAMAVGAAGVLGLRRRRR